jgi:hypothetical protein
MSPRTLNRSAFLLAILALYVFGEHNLYTLAALTLGTAAMVAGHFGEYRPGCVLGMLVVVVAAASSSSLTTLTEFGSLFNAVLGLFVPVVAIIWFALVTGPEEEYWYGLRISPVLEASGFALLCILSVPISIAVIGVTSPHVSARFSELEEISIILLFEAVGAAALSFKEMKQRRI